MTADKRDADYQQLHANQLSTQEVENRASAALILGIVKDFIEIRSLLDVGCGIGTWIKAAVNLGIADATGVEGPWLDPSHAVVPANLIQKADLEKPLTLGRRFDLVVCLEVAEHLPAGAAETLVASLTDHADHILFSAAVPHQGGTHHVNEQFLSYWADLFAKRNYLLVDLIRGRIWDDPSALWWLRQNTVLFVQRDVLQRNASIAAEHDMKRPINIISPENYGRRVGTLQDELNKAKSFADFLINQGKPAIVSRLPDGRIGVRFVT